MNDTGVTKEQLKVGVGVLLIIAIILIAIGLGYMFGPGAGWLVVGVFVFLWARQVLKSLKSDG